MNTDSFVMQNRIPKTFHEAYESQGTDDIYLLFSPETQRVKIGRTTRGARHRLLQLKVGCPDPDARCIAIIKEAGEYDQEIRRVWNDYHSHGEWFNYRGALKQWIESGCNLIDVLRSHGDLGGLVDKRPTQKCRNQPTKNKLTPPELARQLGVAPETIIAWIHAGELRAIDVSRNPGIGRPRYRIDPTDLIAFEANREVRTEAKILRQRKRKDPNVIEFFK